MASEIGSSVYEPEAPEAPTTQRGALNAAVAAVDRAKYTPTPRDTAPALQDRPYDSTRDPEYARQYHQQFVANHIASTETYLDTELKKFTARNDVEDFNERGVLEVWLRLGGKRGDLERAWKIWKSENLALAAVKRATVGAQGEMIALNGPDRHRTSPVNATVKVTAELTKRQKAYRVDHRPRVDDVPTDLDPRAAAIHDRHNARRPTDPRSRKGAFDAAVAAMTRSRP